MKSRQRANKARSEAEPWLTTYSFSAPPTARSFATKLLMAGHRVSMVCTRPTADLINREGTIVRFPIKGRESPLDIASKNLPGTLSAATPDDVDPGRFDLIVLGMQEAQYGASGVRELMGRVAESRKPCLAIMNMPPLPYLKRIPGLSTDTLEACYADPGVWKGFDPALTTLASPDPQAFRPPDQPKNVLHVGLPTNFKAARFDGFGGDDPASTPRGRHRSGAIRPGRRRDRNPGEAQGSRLGFCAAGQMADVDGRQLPLHPARRHDSDQGRSPRERRSGLARSTTGSGDSVLLWVPTRTIWSHSRNMRRPPRALANPRPPPVRFSGEPRTSSASTVWFGASPANRDSNPTRWMRSSLWWTSGSHGIVQPRESGPRGDR